MGSLHNWSNWKNWLLQQISKSSCGVCLLGMQDICEMLRYTPYLSSVWLVYTGTTWVTWSSGCVTRYTWAMCDWFVQVQPESSGALEQWLCDEIYLSNVWLVCTGTTWVIWSSGWMTRYTWVMCDWFVQVQPESSGAVAAWWDIPE